MLSMTGYGSASARVGPASVVVEARAVNQRFLDVRARLPIALAEHAGAMEEVARKQLVRGRVELWARLEGTLVGQVILDRDRAKAALRELAELRDELGSSEPIALSLLSVLPGLFVERPAADSDTLRAGLQQATQAACRELSAMRRTEGRALANDLRARVEGMQQLSARIQERDGELRDAYRDKLRARITSLLEGTGAGLDAGRLEQEVALLADRGDVSEEVTRLSSHCEQFGALLDASDEPVGRRLEFLLQEMGREVNTLGSKVNDLRVTACVLDLKVELERMREQAQNVL
jgi:uncharacterized protein (TIGR00255 family)